MSEEQSSAKKTKTQAEADKAEKEKNVKGSDVKEEKKSDKEEKTDKKDDKKHSDKKGLELDDGKDDVVTLISQEKKEFRVSRKAAVQSQLVRTALEDDKDAKEVSLVHIAAPIVEKVIQYMNYHIDQEPRKIESPLKSTIMRELVDQFDAKFVDDIDLDTLMKLLLAANYMDVKTLTQLICAKIASMMKGKTADQIRKTFNIRGEFTPEELEEIRKDFKELLVE
jgi:S-phase kinase-associated protein 1